MHNHEAELKAELLQETSKISWKDLQYFFAAGKAIYIDSSLDLIQVAYDISTDNKVQIEYLMNEKLIYPVTNDQARDWYDNEKILWAVVVKPWVLVHDKD